ncbi:MAG TPA: hypothetical protein VGS19_09890 [Streptosporangiaceae bacterium]|nr:hypothetical protein [Streptosporangiaceae bacterium]
MAAIASAHAAPVYLRDRRLWWFLRLHVHLALGGLPVLGITGQVFGLLTLHWLALWVLIPLVVASWAVATFDPDPVDRLVLAGVLWGLIAVGGYDVFRLPTVYGAHLWGDFFGMVGGWATDGPPNLFVGYIWRYVGDGCGIAVPFFCLAAALQAGTWRRSRLMALSIGYAVIPVWGGLVATDALAPAGHALFPFTPTTAVLSLIGHLVYGALLGVGYHANRHLENLWPVEFRLTPDRLGRGASQSTLWPDVPGRHQRSKRTQVSAPDRSWLLQPAHNSRHPEPEWDGQTAARRNGESAWGDEFPRPPEQHTSGHHLDPDWDQVPPGAGHGAVDFPPWMIESLDQVARHHGVARESIIKMWIAERLAQDSLA